jgi:hypothetical protein
VTGAIGITAHAASTAAVARFARVRIAGGTVRLVKVRLGRRFARNARATLTLTLTTRWPSGERATTAKRITIRLTKPRFTG